MKATRMVAVAAGWLLLVPVAGSIGVQGGVSAAAGEQEAAPQRALLDQYCVGCHNERTMSGDLRLDNADVTAVAEHSALWERVAGKLKAGMMPPPNMPRPDKATYDGFVTWIESELDAAAEADPNAGRTEMLHRLNRTEYRNAVRDLLALDVDVSELLPVDNAGGGEAAFDNIAETLRLSESLMERYLSAALRVSRLALGRTAPTTELHFDVPSDVPQDVYRAGMPFGTRGGIMIDHTFPVDGEYEFEIELAGRPEEGEEFEISIDGERVYLHELAPSSGSGGAYGYGAPAPSYTASLPVTAGPHDVAVAFIKKTAGVLDEADRAPFFGGRGPLPGVGKVIITGPITDTGVSATPSREKILTCEPAGQAEEASCAESILTRLARLAYRRPLTDHDVDILMAQFEQGRLAGGEFEAGIQRGIRSILANPNFLFRVETDPENAQPGVPYPVNDLELASRLSFFLWSSIPDDELLSLAEEGRLREPGVLEAQVRRMLADERAISLTTSFANQWLWVRNLESAVPFDQEFPNFDATLREAFRTEIELFFDSIVREDRSVLDLLNADYTFVNERLAKHYGIPGVVGPDFQRVSLSEDSPRRGLLGKGHLLLVTSRSTRTSPVVRGVWILRNLLGTPPPAPPPNVPELEEAEQGDGRVLTMRELMAKHRANPVCASCHATIDPVGFALEQFDAVGKWREVDNGFNAIDASGTMPDGTEFDSFQEFREALVENPETFLRTMAEKLLIYALGRPTHHYDQPAVREIVRQAAADDYRFSAMVMAVVESVPFQKRMPAASPELQLASADQ